MHKQIILLVGLGLLTAGATVFAVGEFKHHQNVTDAAVMRAVSERDRANQTADGYRMSLKTANGQVRDLSAQKAALCSQITAAKLKNPACQ